MNLFESMPTVETNMFSRGQYGKGTCFLGGPICLFQGSEIISCCINATPKEIITSKILEDVLQHIDQIRVFSRLPNHPTPFPLLENHGSRLEDPFLSYANYPRYK